MSIPPRPIRTQELALQPFQDSQWRVEVSLEWRPGRLDYAFRLQGKEGATLPVVQPPKEHPERREELWRSTCFELFLAAPAQAGYLELNLAPSGDWNLYAFDAYREGMRPVETTAPPVLTYEGDGVWRGHLRQGVTIPSVLELLGEARLDIGVATVLAYGDGRLEHHALTHAPERPDFHLRSTFLAVFQENCA